MTFLGRGRSIPFSSPQGREGAEKRKGLREAGPGHQEINQLLFTKSV